MKTMKESIILKFEACLALPKMKSNKATEPDRIVIEILSALADFGINKFIEIIHQ